MLTVESLFEYGHLAVATSGGPFGDNDGGWSLGFDEDLEAESIAVSGRLCMY